MLSGSSTRAHYHIPPQNPRFVGREKALETLQKKLFADADCQKVTVVGLGGVGKTQLVLQLAYWTKQHHPQISVFWVPVLSHATFNQGYSEIAKKLSIRPADPGEDPREPVRKHLSSESAGPWLIILDNADDKELVFDPHGMYRYIPSTTDGLVLLTTRSQELAVSFADSDVVELNEMDATDAKSFLERSLIQKFSHQDADAPGQLLEELTYLPLAIKQAAAYINTNKISIAAYLRLLRGTEQSAIALLRREFHDSTRYEGRQNGVASTWIVSFDQIRRFNRSAADLLAFMSCIEPKAIPASVFPSPEPEEMTCAIGTLCGYAFLTRRGDSDVFDMHTGERWSGGDRSTLFDEDDLLEPCLEDACCIFPSTSCLLFFLLLFFFFFFSFLFPFFSFLFPFFSFLFSLFFSSSFVFFLFSSF